VILPPHQSSPVIYDQRLHMWNATLVNNRNLVDRLVSNRNINHCNILARTILK